MKSVALGKTDVRVSAIGLGCVGLTAMPRATDALNLLACAFDLGITHFDTARSYGAGFSEEILGKFARGRRDRVTIATKFGISPPPLVIGNRRFVAAVKRALRVVPVVDRLVRRRLAAPSANGYEYSPDKCRQSLERSLQTLGLDHVDLFLLHNGHRSDAEQDDLIDAAVRLGEQGKILAFGISAPIAYVGDDLDALPPVYQVAQGDHGVIGGGIWKNDGGRGIISFATQSRLAPLVTVLTENREAARCWSSEVGADLLDTQMVARLLVEYALAANHDGSILIGTRNPDHLATAARAAERPTPPDQLAAFGAMCAELLPQPSI